MNLTNSQFQNIDTTVPSVGSVRRVTFKDGTALTAVLCPDHSLNLVGIFEGTYWLAMDEHGQEWSDFAHNVTVDRVGPSLLDREEEARFIADLAVRLREKILDSLPERQAAAVARRREEDPDFRPELDYMERVGSDEIDYAQLADVLHALAARFTDRPLLHATPLPSED